MSEGVGGDVSLQVRQGGILLHNVADGLGGQGVAGFVDEEMAVAETELLSHPLIPFQRILHRFVSVEDEAFFIALADDADGAVEEVHVRILDVAQFLDPDAGGKEHFQHQDVPVMQELSGQAQGAAGVVHSLFVDGGQDPADFVQGHGGWQPVRFPDPHLDPAEGGFINDAVRFQPFVVASQGGDLALCAADGKVAVQVGYVVLEFSFC